MKGKEKISTPRDAFWKFGVGGFALLVEPSLEPVIYTMSGNNGQYDPTFTNIPRPAPRRTRDDGIRRVLEMVIAAVRMH